MAEKLNVKSNSVDQLRDQTGFLLAFQDKTFFTANINFEKSFIVFGISISCRSMTSMSLMLSLDMKESMKNRTVTSNSVSRNYRKLIPSSLRVLRLAIFNISLSLS
ncbi:11602_t:CDS:2 [Funneliformis mosseae]|uniref:11602_t:CDS:1 n=1 Tax=Funneliformis mosseae TaxID=27381 RepID=A0A9N8VBZ3_FUNMO|nr:11602_t:CDS:2 [Funneliformis mosseae]